MNGQKEKDVQVSLSLTGNLLQFNISVLVLAALILAFFCVSVYSSNLFVMYAGFVVSVMAIIGLLWFVVNFYSKHKNRPLDGQPVSLIIKDARGGELSVSNPPDAFFDDGEINAVVRQFLVGYDENLCPVGEVIGKASDGEMKLLTEDEKTDFIQNHRAEIKGKKSQALEIIKEMQCESGLDKPAGIEGTQVS